MYVDQVWSSPLLDGVPGTGPTLASMAAIVRRDARSLPIRDKALQIVSACGGHDFGCEIRALFEYCRDQVVYRRDPVEQERVQDAPRTLFVYGSGDCDDKCVCLATLLASLGHRSRFKVIGKRGSYSHVYLEVRHPRGGWIPLDPTPEQSGPGWEAKGYDAATYEIFPTGRSSPMLLLGLAAAAYYFLMR